MQDSEGEDGAAVQITMETAARLRYINARDDCVSFTAKDCPAQQDGPYAAGTCVND